MYIRIKQTPNSPRQSVQIVEGHRDASGKVKQRVVRHLGVFHDEKEKLKLTALAEELISKIKEEKEDNSGQLRLDLDMGLSTYVPRRKVGRPTKKTLKNILPPNQVKLDEIVEVKRIVEGVHEVGGHVYKQLGFDELLKHKKDRDVLTDLVLSRMVNPASKRGMVSFCFEQFNKEHDLDIVYRLMDKLHEKIPTIKELCFKATLSLIPNKEVSLIFFDVTTLYFESVEEDNIRDFGYSKDMRFNTTQVVLALATQEDGLPIGYELFSGNTAEVKTLLKSIDSWKSFFSVKQCCFVADRAMFTKGNLQALDESGYKYIVAAKLRTLNEKTQNKILSDNGYKPAVIGDEFGWVQELEFEGKRLITSYKSARARNDSEERDRILEKIQKNIGTIGKTKRLITNTGVKRYTSSDNGYTTVDQDKIENDSAWDGLHGVITNDKTISATEAIVKYSRLWVIEAQFRLNEHLLQMRPIFHWIPRRIESHIAICYMSFTVLKHIEYRARLMQKISPAKIIQTLLSVQSSILQHKYTKDLYKLPSSMNNEAGKIYKVFNITRDLNATIYMK